MTLPVSATDYTKVGVRVGDTADYTYYNPSETGTIHIQILQIAGTNVTVNMSESSSKGQVRPNQIVTVDLSATINLLLTYLVAANLTQGDSVIPQNTQYVIDESITTNFAGVNRTINHANFNITLPDNTSGYYINIYWDKATGLGIKTNITITGEYSAMLRTQAGSYITTLRSTTAFDTENTADNSVALLITAAVAATAAIAIATVVAIKARKPKT
jgi:hypothetical protein